MTQDMTWFQEKLMFGAASLSSGTLLWLGAIMTAGEARWLYITAASSVMTAGFLSLVFRRATESIRVVIGRSGLATLGGVFGTKAAVHLWDIHNLVSDGIALAGISAGVCTVTFMVGVKALNALTKRSDDLVSRVVDALLPPTPPQRRKRDEEE